MAGTAWQGTRCMGNTTHQRIQGAPKSFSKSCSFQAILREQPLFWVTFGLRAPLGVKTPLAPWPHDASHRAEMWSFVGAFVRSPSFIWTPSPCVRHWGWWVGHVIKIRTGPLHTKRTTSLTNNPPGNDANQLLLLQWQQSCSDDKSKCIGLDQSGDRKRSEREKREREGERERGGRRERKKIRKKERKKEILRQRDGPWETWGGTSDVEMWPLQHRIRDWWPECMGKMIWDLKVNKPHIPSPSTDKCCSLDHPVFWGEKPSQLMSMCRPPLK